MWNKHQVISLQITDAPSLALRNIKNNLHPHAKLREDDTASSMLDEHDTSKKGMQSLDTFQRP
jgi:hypothetical protein